MYKEMREAIDTESIQNVDLHEAAEDLFCVFRGA